MRTKRNSYLILLLGMMFLVAAACAYNIGLVQSTYTLLSVSKTSYDTGMKICADLYRQGRITEREKETIIAVGTVYAESHNLAVKALADYEKTKDLADQERLTAQIEISTRSLSRLLELLQPFLTEVK